MAREDEKSVRFSLPIKRVPEVLENEQVDLKDKVALVTGGSRGIGKATCKRLSKAGCKVVGTSRYPNQYSVPDDYKLLELDVRSDVSVKKCIDTVIDLYGRIDILINNAGIGQYGRLITSTALEPSYVASTFADKEQVAHYVNTEPDSQDSYVQLNAVFFPMAVKRGMAPAVVADAIYRIACSKEPHQQYFIDKEHERIVGIGKSIDEMLTLVYLQPIEQAMKEISLAIEYVAKHYGKFSGLISFFQSL